jgi:transcriptional regulator with XRE-family HTH domain
MNREAIAAQLKDRREELGLSQRALAEAAGVGEATIIRMEQAKFWPNVKQLIAVCEALDLTISLND